MGTPKEAPVVLPPYVPYKTFINFIASLRQGVPGRIDRTLMGSFSGTTQNQLFQALRYLKLIHEGDIPDDQLETLAKAEGPSQQKVLREVLEASYPFLFGANGFNLANATVGQFEEQFKKTGATGDTVRKCGSFFLAAAKDAEIPISPRITKLSRPRTNSARPNRQRTEQTSKRSADKTVGSKSPIQPTLPTLETVQPVGSTTRTVELRGGQVLTLSVTGNLFMLERRDRAFVFKLLDDIEAHERGNTSTQSAVEEEAESTELSPDDIPF